MTRAIKRLSRLLVCLVWVLPVFGELVTEDLYTGLLLGYGVTHPGFGETSERVQVVDVIPRFSFVLDDKLGSDWYQFNHEFWIEIPVSVMLSDSDSVDHHDIGLISTTFLLALVSKAHATVEPYLTVGGGPVYLAGDIDGVGSDIFGNYQLGLGLRYQSKAGRIWMFECRYHHLSNLDMASPNVPLNSTKFAIGTILSF